MSLLRFFSSFLFIGQFRMRGQFRMTLAPTPHYRPTSDRVGDSGEWGIRFRKRIVPERGEFRRGFVSKIPGNEWEAGVVDRGLQGTPLRVGRGGD